MADRLVIGVGNDLRGDDGVGHVVARRIELLGLPGVRTLMVTQLTPELVERMTGCELALVVDADVAADAVGVRRVEPGGGGSMTHHVTADSLVGLGASIGLDLPPTFVLGVPAHEFALGETLSPRTADAVEAAVAAALEVLARGAQAGARVTR